MGRKRKNTCAIETAPNFGVAGKEAVARTSIKLVCLLAIALPSQSGAQITEAADLVDGVHEEAVA